MRWILLASAAMLAAGCSTAATTQAASAPAALPAGCSTALAMLPPVPATAQQAADDVTLLGGRKGTTLDAMLDKVAADASSIGMGLDTGSGDVTAAVSAFKADTAAVRSYCA